MAKLCFNSFNFYVVWYNDSSLTKHTEFGYLTDLQRSTEVIDVCLAKNSTRLCVILDLNGLLLQCCFSKSKKFQSFQVGKQWVVLRPRCIEFLDALFSRFRVGVWSTALLKNVTVIIRCLESYAKRSYPFFMVWGQEKCHRHPLKVIYRPDKMGVEAMFKPLKYVWDQYGSFCEHSNTILIDDSPYKGCPNPIENCIYPRTFDVNQGDSLLIEELLPYLTHLSRSIDAREIIKLDRYGLEPVQYGHELYANFKEVMDTWHKVDDNDVSSSSSVQPHNMNHGNERYVQSSITSCLKRSSIVKGSSSNVSSHLAYPLGVSQVSRLKKIPLVSTLKDMEAMQLAHQLGYSKDYINGHAARCFIKNLQKLYFSKK